ncbi:MAG: Crp/Fnr family transcriptional regulator [Clostridiales bacterium]|nr:Crp/Fnr family transcriptional regulator [Clostridiales bacterium]
MKTDWSPLAEGRPAKTYSPGQFIYLQGTDAKYFYYLAEGTARSFISSSEGSERLLTVHHTGDLMGEASFFDQCPRVSSAVAVTVCKVVSVDRAQLDQVFQNHPELAFPMLRYLSRTVRLLSGHVDDISFRPADRRVARALLDQAGPDGMIRCTQEELGSAVGTSRVTVSRVLSQFAARGWLERGYRNLRLLNRNALEEYADSDD